MSFKPFPKLEPSLKTSYILKPEYSNQGFYEIFKLLIYLNFFCFEFKIFNSFHLVWITSLLFLGAGQHKKKQAELNLDMTVLLASIIFPPAPKHAKKLYKAPMSNPFPKVWQICTRHLSQTFFQKFDISASETIVKQRQNLFQSFAKSVHCWVKQSLVRKPFAAWTFSKSIKGLCCQCIQPHCPQNLWRLPLLASSCGGCGLASMQMFECLFQSNHGRFFHHHQKPPLPPTGPHFCQGAHTHKPPINDWC